MTPSNKPVVLPVIPDNLPAELRGLPQFGVWRFEETTDPESGEIEWDKIPLDARTGRRASSVNPATWTTLDRAVRAYRRGGFDGIAFFLRDGGGIVGIDLDKCIDPASGTVEEWAQRIVDLLDTSTEISPSKRGLHLFLSGQLPPRDRREGRFECYERARFLTLTGQRLPGTPPAVAWRQEELTALHAEIFAARAARRNAAPPPSGPVLPHALTDLEILERAGAARNGAKFRRLYGGDFSEYGSRSEADAALCSLLAFYAGPDPARIDELFRGSGLMREKWNRPDYRDSTIALALSGRGDYYRPRRSVRVLHGPGGHRILRAAGEVE